MGMEEHLDLLKFLLLNFVPDCEFLDFKWHLEICQASSFGPTSSGSLNRASENAWARQWATLVAVD